MQPYMLIYRQVLTEKVYFFWHSETMENYIQNFRLFSLPKICLPKTMWHHYQKSTLLFLLTTTFWFLDQFKNSKSGSKIKNWFKNRKLVQKSKIGAIMENLSKNRKLVQKYEKWFKLSWFRSVRHKAKTNLGHCRH